MDRKKLRLNGFDYSTNGAYFITLCTKNKKCILSSIEKSGYYSYPKVQLTKIGNTVKKYLDNIPGITYYVIMPNHIHLLLQLHAADAAGHMGPALQDVIRWYKTMTTNACIQAVINGKMRPFEKTVWQTSFYDEVIRDESHYLRIWQIH